MKYSNREIRAALREQYNSPYVGRVEYLHCEMFVNELLNSNIWRNLDKKPLYEGGAS